MKKRGLTSKNYLAIKKLKLKDYAGKCLGLADGKVVIKRKSAEDVMDTLFKKYSDQETALVCVPKKNKIFVL